MFNINKFNTFRQTFFFPKFQNLYCMAAGFKKNEGM